MSINTEGLKKPSFLPLLIITALAIGLYLNTLKNGFVYDDEFTIINNTFIKSFDNLPLLFDKIAYFSRSGEASYRPIVTFTYFIDDTLYGLRPWGYHLTNVLLHALNGALLYFFLTLLLTPHYSRLTSPPFLISLLFVTHPVLTEAVNCISYREDLLTFLFYVATLSLYLILRQQTSDHRPPTTALFYLLSCLTYLLALLSKEMAVTLPLIVFCYEWLYGREKVAAAPCAADIRAALDAAATKTNDNMPFRPFNRYTAGYLTITIFYLYLRFYLFYNTEKQMQGWGLVERFLTLPWLIMSYLRLSLFPVHLSADYVINPVSSPFSPIFILSIIALVSIFTIIFLYSPFNKRRDKRFHPLAKESEGGFGNVFLGHRSILFGTIFFLITLTPVYNLAPLSNPFVERYLYLPVAGFTMFVVLLTYLIAEKLKVRPEYGNSYMPIFFLVVLIIFSFSVVKRNTIWRDDISLWSDTVVKMPNSYRAQNGIGIAYFEQGRYDEAIREYLMIIKLRFNDAKAHYNLGLAYLRQGRYDEAIYELKTAIMLKPDFVEPHSNLGIAYARQGLLDQAIKEFLTAIILKPDDAKFHYNLGVAYFKQGLYDEVINEFTIALKLKPDYKEAYRGLEKVHMGKKKRVIKDAGNVPAGQDKNWSH